MKVKIKKLKENAKIPTKGTEKSGCYDLYATERNIIFKEETGIMYVVYNTGIAIELPEGYDALIFPRSSIRDKMLILANSVGYIDNDYRGEITASFKYDINSLGRSNDLIDSIYQVGDRIAQIRLIKKDEFVWEEVEELSKTTRGEGGHGSTGK